MDNQNYNQLVDTSVKALIHSLLSTLNFIFLTPYRLWVKSGQILAAQRDAKLFDMSGINTPWPFFTFVKRFLVDFLFDALSFLAYPIGVLVAFIAFFASISDFGEAVVGFFGVLLGAYFMPILFCIYRDSLQLLLIPFRKFLSWGSKPAQYMDLNVDNKVVAKVEKE